MIGIYCHHTSIFSHNTGIQRCVRATATALHNQHELIVPLVWNQTKNCFCLANQKALEHLSLWGGPSLDSWCLQFPPRDSWIIVIELISGPNQPSQCQLIASADENGWKSLAVFHDDIPFGSQEQEGIGHNRYIDVDLKDGSRMSSMSHYTHDHTEAHMDRVVETGVGMHPGEGTGGEVNFPSDYSNSLRCQRPFSYSRWLVEDESHLPTLQIYSMSRRRSCRERNVDGCGKKKHSCQPRHRMPLTTLLSCRHAASAVERPCNHTCLSPLHLSLPVWPSISYRRSDSVTTNFENRQFLSSPQAADLPQVNVVCLRRYLHGPSIHQND